MSDSNSLTLSQSAPPLVQPEPQTLLQVIAQAVADPRMDVEKMERLLSMHRMITEEQRQVAFKAALAQLEAELPQIEKGGKIIVKGQERSRYAKLEDIDTTIRPLLEEHGFAFSFDTSSTDGRLFLISAKLSHREGYAETKSLLLPIDASDYRSAVQSIGSTLSYGKRQLIKMHLNIVERDEDTDGNDMDEIDEEQIKDIETQIMDTGANLKKFCEYMGVESVEQIRRRDLPKAMAALVAKRRTKQL